MANGLAADLTAFLGNAALALPPALDTASLARQAAFWLASHDGATFNLFFGNMAGQSLYAVSLYPERSVVIPGKIVLDDLLQKFIDDN